jgi:small subunit ribosomal protein S16
MPLKLRLARAGTKKRPVYRVVVADSRSPRDGRFIEKIGHYNPTLPAEHPDRVQIDADRAKYWLGVGAQPTDRVTLLMSRLGLVEKPVFVDNPKKAAPKAKAKERAAMEAQKAEEAASAEAAA